jgi:hypothetical protein
VLTRLPRVALVTATLVLAITASASAAASPLRGYWPFSEGSGQVVRDLSPYRNDGRLGRTTGADASDGTWVPGVFGIGRALRLGGNDFVLMQDTASLRPQRVTVEAWVRADRSPGRWKYLLSKGGDRCQAGSFGLYTSENGGLAFYVYDGRRWWRSPELSPSVWDGRWHYVAGTYDGSFVRLFVDGRQVGTGRAFSGTIDYDLPNRSVYVGAYRGACDLTFVGDVDEVRIWSAALPLNLLDDVLGALSRP